MVTSVRDRHCYLDKMVQTLCLACVALLSTFRKTSEFPNFRKSIPNGFAVPDPCRPGKTWNGVGHLMPSGGGSRNPFGRDFTRNGYKWTVELCSADSDGDGKTNGEELGDPRCAWRQGDGPPKTEAISHPGICDIGPCETNNGKVPDFCIDINEFNCSNIYNPDVKNFTLKFPPTKVPTKETNYFCMTFDLAELGMDVSKEYHIVATKTIVGGPLLHHVLYYKCVETPDPKTKTPFACGMFPSSECHSMIGGWTLGAVGECYHSNVGFRIGRESFTHMSLQLHWNNPELLDNQYDASGVVFYYTEKLRVNDAAVVTFGHESFHIPARRSSYIVESRCLPSCTRRLLKGPVNIVGVVNHMHYLGQEVRIEQRRADQIIRIFAQHSFNYDDPKFFVYDTPILFAPGDELRLVCNFSSISRNTTTNFGDSTYDEMCYSFVTLYPRENLASDAFCTHPVSCNNCQDELHNIANSLSLVCDVTSCREDTCPAAIEKWRSNSCMKKDFRENVHYTGTAVLVNFMASCKAKSCRPYINSLSKNTIIRSSSFYCLREIERNETLREAYIFVVTTCQDVICTPSCEGKIRFLMKHAPCYWDRVNGYDRQSLLTYARLHTCDSKICGKREAKSVTDGLKHRDVVSVTAAIWTLYLILFRFVCI